MENNLRETNASACPKRPWVLLTLSDDEALGEDGAIPPGLQFHLSRCAECRALAERLLSVSSDLHALADRQPGQSLAEAANSRALDALASGAELTGRVEIPDEPEPVRGAPFGWLRAGRYAAAAAVFIALSLFGLSTLTGEKGDNVVDGTPVAGRPLEGVARATKKTPAGGEQVRMSDEVPGEAGPAVAAAGERLAERDEAGPAPLRRRRIPRHHSHVEAAMSDDPYNVQSAVVLPDASRRNLGWGRVFDRARSSESTIAPRQKP
jgi:hypothetical protein